VIGAWIQGFAAARAGLGHAGLHPVLPQHAAAGQLYFFYFALASYLKLTGPNGMRCGSCRTSPGRRFCLSFYACAFNVEIFPCRHRGGSARDHEAAESLGYSRLKAYIY